MGVLEALHERVEQVANAIQPKPSPQMRSIVDRVLSGETFNNVGTAQGTIFNCIGTVSIDGLVYERGRFLTRDQDDDLITVHDVTMNISNRNTHIRIFKTDAILDGKYDVIVPVDEFDVSMNFWQVKI